MSDRPLRELVHTDVVGVRPDSFVNEALRLMRECRISCVVALEQGRPVGIVTERDAVEWLAQGLDPAATTMARVMSAPVHTAHLDSPALDAILEMHRLGLRRLVVVDDQGTARGVVTQSDIAGQTRGLHDLERLDRRLEQLVVDRTRDLSRKARELAEANERLRSLDEIKTSFLSSVSHELRTPLTSLLGFAKLITKDFSRSFAPQAAETDQAAKAERISRNLDIIVQESERLTRLINDFLDLSRIEAGRMNWRDSKVAVADCVQRAAGAVRMAFDGDSQVCLRVNVPRDLPRLRVDPDRLEQILLNLLDNAAKFTERGAVTVDVIPDGGTLHFCVSDTGHGIDPVELDGIFDKFRQAKGGDTTRERPKGTGLGLSICKEIVEHYGGRIWAESEPGKGSRFHFLLPMAPDVHDRPVAQVSGEEGSPLILVVDDDPAVCSYLIQFFESEGYRVASARDGASGLAAARELRPDLVTMDLLMPDMDGHQAIAALRADPDLAAIPVLVISVLADEETGADDAQARLNKPINEHRLMETVTALLTRRHRKRLIPVLREHFPARDRFFTLLLGDIAQCDEQGLWERLDSGFEGTVILPDWAADGLDLTRLQARPGVQILIMPEN